MEEMNASVWKMLVRGQVKAMDLKWLECDDGLQSVY